MDEFDRRVFADLFRAAVEKCFGQPLRAPLAEPESRHLSTEIEESTGLVVGWRSLKNYAIFLLSPAPDKPENPSIATLDTLARYVLDAPVTTEAERKKTEEHFPYWFRYREQTGVPRQAETIKKQANSGQKWVVAASLLLGVVLLGGYLFLRSPDVQQVIDDFRATDERALRRHGWMVQTKNVPFWNRRAEKPGRLSLFTLKGDNWPKTGETPRIQNLLVQAIQNDCFYTEVHVNDFVPAGNWQQTGLLLLEDTLFTGKSIRLSLSYNDYFGGYDKPAEILIQGISSYGKGYANLEEFIHQPLFQAGTAEDRRIAATNLKNFAFRIEKQGPKFRFLYSASPVDNFSFKEIATHEFTMTPRYIGLFALKGFVDTTAVVPVTVRYFRLEGQPCN